MRQKQISSKFLKYIAACFLTVIMVICMLITASAHSGRTDANGGHRDNKNKSGLGSYHYHCGGYPAHLHDGGVCPYTAAVPSTSGGGSSNTPQVAKPSSVSISEKPTEIRVGETATCKASVYPANAEDAAITWKSSDESVAVINKDGVISAIGIGTANITALTSNGVKSSFAIEVKEIPVAKVVITVQQESITHKESIQLEAVCEPDNATYKDIHWKSNNEDVAYVTDEGALTAVSPGQAEIVASHQNVSSSFVITVKEIEPRIITLSTDEERVQVGKTLDIIVDIRPTDAANKSVIWTISDEQLASIDSGVLKGKRSGTVTITATTFNGLEDTIDIEVYSNVPLYVFWTLVGIGISLLFYKAIKNGKFDKASK